LDPVVPEEPVALPVPVEPLELPPAVPPDPPLELPPPVDPLDPPLLVEPPFEPPLPPVDPLEPLPVDPFEPEELLDPPLPEPPPPFDRFSEPGDVPLPLLLHATSGSATTKAKRGWANEPREGRRATENSGCIWWGQYPICARRLSDFQGLPPISIAPSNAVVDVDVDVDV
jgi:hypothetical protein